MDSREFQHSDPTSLRLRGRRPQNTSFPNNELNADGYGDIAALPVSRGRRKSRPNAFYNSLRASDLTSSLFPTSARSIGYDSTEPFFADATPINSAHSNLAESSAVRSNDAAQSAREALSQGKAPRSRKISSIYPEQRRKKRALSRSQSRHRESPKRRKLPPASDNASS